MTYATLAVIESRFLAARTTAALRLRRRIDWILQEQGRLLFATVSRPALGHIQPPIQWVPGALPEDKAAGV
jgi:hypothetical protein